MSELDRLVAELCPDGVEYAAIKDVCSDLLVGGDLPQNFAKGQKSPSEEFPYPIYSNGTEESALYGYTESYRIEKEAITISARGTIGFHAIRSGKFTPIVRLITLIADESKITTKFLNYALSVVGLEGVTTGIPSLTLPMLKKYKIPIPPLAIQREIVRILDNFTELTAKLTVKLTAELTARKKQYEYYRNELLALPNAPRVSLGEIGRVAMCKRIMKAETSPDGDVPFYKIGTFGKSPDAYISAKTYERYRRDYSFPNKGDILISAAGTIGRAVIYDGEASYYQDSNIVWLEHDESQVINKYLYYCYQLSPWHVSSGGTIARLYNDNISKTEIPLPSLPIQRELVRILDKFDTLTTDIASGILVEIEARRKQYEYYRDKLLTFERKEVET